jgi:hypothetical protein
MERAIQQVDTSWHGHGCREIYDIHVVGKAEKRVDTKGTLQLILGNILKRKQAAKSPTNLADRQAK